MSEDEGDEGSVRNRFPGSAQDLADAILPYAEKHGKSFIRYPTDGKLSKAKIDVPSIEKVDELIRICVELQKNLCFSKKQADGCMDIIQKKLSKKWGLAASDVPDWLKTISGRFRNVMHVVEKAIEKKNPPKRTQRLGIFDSGEPDLEVPKEDLPKYKYGWLPDLNVAFRLVKGGSEDRQEPSEPIILDPEQEDHQPVTARWPDGHEWVCPYVTHGSLKAAQRKKAPNEGTLWSSEHTVTHNKVTIIQRTDRSLLLSVMDQAKQVLQARADLFGDLPGPQPSAVPKDTPAIQAAIFDSDCRKVLPRQDRSAGLDCRARRAAQEDWPQDFTQDFIPTTCKAACSSRIGGDQPNLLLMVPTYLPICFLCII